MGELAYIGVFEDGLVLHCAAEDCERIAYTVTRGEAICWGHLKEARETA